MTTQPTSHSSIHTRLTEIIGTLGHIEKADRMGDGNWGYNFRSIEAIKGHLKPLLQEHGVHYNAQDLTVLTDEALSGNKRRVVLHITWAISCDGDAVLHHTVGEAIDSSDKTYAKAMTQAEKYMLIQAFCISDGSGEGEGDRERPETEPAFTVNRMKAVALHHVLNDVQHHNPDRSITADMVKEFMRDWWEATSPNEDHPSEERAAIIAKDAAAEANRTISDWAPIDPVADAAAQLAELTDNTDTEGN